MGYALPDLIDLDRYPIDDLAGRGAALVESCIARMRDTAMCHLPGSCAQMRLNALGPRRLRAGRQPIGCAPSAAPTRGATPTNTRKGTRSE